jgi:hypothetical protein
VPLSIMTSHPFAEDTILTNSMPLKPAASAEEAPTRPSEKEDQSECGTKENMSHLHLKTQPDNGMDHSDLFQHLLEEPL